MDLDRRSAYMPRSESIRNPAIFELNNKAQAAASRKLAKTIGAISLTVAGSIATFGAVEGFNDSPQATVAKKGGTIDDLSSLTDQEKTNLLCLREVLYEEEVADILSLTNLTANTWADENCSPEFFGNYPWQTIADKKNTLLDQAGYPKTALKWLVRKDEYGGTYLEETVNP